MSYNQYQGYGGSPYGDSNGDGNYGANPYGGRQDYGQQNHSQQQNPYGGEQYNQEPTESNPYAPASQTSSHVLPPPTNGPNGPTAQPSTVLSNQDFLSRVEALKSSIRTLTSQISQIASTHQRTLTSPSANADPSLSSLITDTQILNTSIKDQIRFLETDAKRSGGSANGIKATQVSSLKSSFKKQLEEYRREERDYEVKYREQIARSYRIVNPDASEAEVEEAKNANWGDEGVFQTALKTNRTATASSVLGAVRARHADILQIERTMRELADLIDALGQQVVLQDEPIKQTEDGTGLVKGDVERGNTHLEKAEESARRARRLKWWCFWIVVVIVVALGLVLGLVFGLRNRV
ncbi:t-SNARE [Elsinoe ampelina]|uniref:t-SNARE n=1 Tax=Elsinoe ampelina TaxID=302913 RepID=A0A6A6G8M2_9PEZI|nr:t-SNARE [Elsinoe ampelina]